MTTATFVLLLLATQDAAARLAAGQEKLRLRDYDGAIPEFEACLKLDPSQFNAHFGLGVCRWEKEEYRASRDHFARVLEIVGKQNPGAALLRVHQKLLGCDLVLERFDDAIRDATALIDVQPIGEYYYDRALARQRKGDWEGALEDCSRALAESPTLVKVRTLRAQTLLLKGDVGSAFEEYGAAVAAKPEDREGYLGRGSACYFQDRWKEAEIDLRKARLYNVGVRRDLDEYAYTVSLLWLAHVRRADREAAAREVAGLDALLKEEKLDPAKSRYVRIARYLAGEVEESALVAAAEKETSSPAQALSEAHFFVGERKLVAGDLRGAREAFLKCVAAGAKGNLENDTAVRRLKSIGDQNR